MNPHISASFMTAWFERMVEVKFDRSKQQIEALYRAAGRLRREAACQIIETDHEYICYLVKRDPKMYRFIPFSHPGPIIVRPLPPRDAAIANHFRDLVLEENSRTPSQTASRSEDEISLLGIAETILAISASILLAVYLEDFRHIVVGTLLAPLFMLRSNDVNDRILCAAERYFDWICTFTFQWDKQLRNYYELTRCEPRASLHLRRKVKFNFSLLGFFLTDLIMKGPGTLFGFQFIKLAVSAHYAICHPLLSLSQIPSNWRRIALCANSLQIPEVLPGIEDEGAGRYEFGWWRISSQERVMWSIPEYERAGAGQDFVILVWVPAFLSRLIFKSTTLFWSPLLWVAYPLRQTANIIASMKRVCSGALYKAQRVYSVTTIVAFVAKIAAFSVAVNWLTASYGYPTDKLVQAIIVPDGIPPWQIACVFNATITLVLYFVADYYLHEFDETKRLPSEVAVRSYQTALIVRNVMSIYIVACTTYILVQVGAAVHWPPLQSQIFPWS
jgi:hypothetical protein